MISAEVDFGHGPVLTSSFYVPNGGKDYDAKLRFLEAMDGWAGEAQAAGRPLLFCGDLNVARTDLDIHPKERKPNQVGARPDERALIERLLTRGLVDVGRTPAPGRRRASSRGGRRGATSSSATSAGGSTTSSPPRRWRGRPGPAWCSARSDRATTARSSPPSADVPDLAAGSA